MQSVFKKVDPPHLAAAVFLFSCMAWHFKFKDDSILGKVAMVSAIIASTLYHRIAGIMALTVFIALMKNKFNWKMKMSTEQKKEGFTPMVANSSVQNLKNYVKDSANNVKDSANIVKDKLKESFSRFSFSS